MSLLQDMNMTRELDFSGSRLGWQRDSLIGILILINPFVREQSVIGLGSCLSRAVNRYGPKKGEVHTKTSPFF